MKTITSRYCLRIVTFVSILLAVIFTATGCVQKVPNTVDIPVGDDLTTKIVEGRISSPYGGDIPISILKGTYTKDFSATVKVTGVEDTRTIRTEITSPTKLGSQDPKHITVIFYLCQPLSPIANKLFDGSIVYIGNKYPKILVGQSYDVVGVLQPGWQDYPYVYVPSALEFKQALAETAADTSNKQMLMTAARSFAEQALAAGNHHLTAEPVITVSSKQVQSGKMAVIMYIHTMDAMNSGDPDSQPIIVGELQYLRDHGTELSAAARKAVEDDISKWRNTIGSAMNTPTETSYLIKVVGDVDLAGNIDASSLQVYADEGPPRGNAWVLATQYFKNMRSARVTVAQAYASAASIAAAAKAP